MIEGAAIDSYRATAATTNDGVAKSVEIEVPWLDAPAQRLGRGEDQVGAEGLALDLSGFPRRGCGA